MIQIVCDRCDRPLEVEDRLAGDKYSCPHCGDVNRVPKNPESVRVQTEGSGNDRAAQQGLPPDSGPEQGVLTLRPAWFRAQPLKIGGGLLVVASGFGGALWFGVLIATPIGWLGLLLVVLGLIAGLWLMWMKVMTYSRQLEITNKRTIERRGLLSKATSEVVHDNIRNFQITQTMWQRIWGVGTVGISSSGQDGIEIEIRDLPNPNALRRVIDLYRPL